MATSERRPGIETLEAFFYPKSIAVIGASDDEGKAGHQILKNLINLGFAGPLYPVNPSKPKILGLDAYPSVADVPGAVDLMVVTIPAHGVPEVFRQAAARKDVRAAVVVASGFSETGDPERAALEREMKEIAAAAGIRIIGPNCVGVMNTETHLDTTFAAGVKQNPGGMSVISQSGSLGASLMMFAGDQPVPVGFAKWAHVGNQADVDLLEILRYYKEDPATRSIAVYMEGLTDARAFMEVASEVARTKPVVVLKVGRSEMGAGAAASHTGSLAGADAIYDGAFEQAGILRVNSLEELLDTAKALSTLPLPAGNRLAVLTEAGGPGIIAMDELGLSSHVELADFKPETLSRLRDVLPPMAIIGHTRGYIDMSAAADEEQHRLALEAVLDDPGVDGVVVLSVPPTFLKPRVLGEEVARALAGRPEAARKPVVACYLAGDWVKEGRGATEAAGVPTFDMPERAARALANVVKRALWLKEQEERADVGEGGSEGRPAAPAPEAEISAILQRAREEDRSLLEPEARELLARYGVPAGSYRLAATAREAVAAAEALGYPVVMKIVSPDIVHKSDAGGVKLNLKDPQAVEAAWEEILQNVAAYRSRRGEEPARIEGILVAPMVPQDTEVIIGGLRDEQFGPVVMFGLGGIFVEVLKDVTFRMAPVTLAEAQKMVRSIRSFPILAGARGQEPADLDGLAEMLVAVSRILVENPDIREVDLNPVLARPASKGGVLALDARVLR